MTLKLQLASFHFRERSYNRTHVVCAGLDRVRQVYLSLSNSLEVSVIDRPKDLGQFVLFYQSKLRQLLTKLIGFVQVHAH